MDLNQVRISLDPVEMFLEHPLTGEVMDGETDPVFMIVPVENEKVKSAEREFRNKLLKKMGSKNLGTAEEFDRQETEILMASIVDWKNVEDGTEVLTCTPQNKRKLLTNPELSWIRDQVKSFINTTQNFMTKA